MLNGNQAAWESPTNSGACADDGHRKRIALVTGLWLCAFLSMPSIPAGAATVDTMRAQVEVADRSEAERARGFSRAMAQVLVKVSGQRDVLSLPESRSLVSGAQRFIRSWSYEQVPVGSGASGPDGAPQVQLVLQAQFDPEAVHGALVRSGIPVWPSERPDVLLVLVLERGYERYFIEGGDPLLREAAATARERAIPVLWPIFDLDDLRQLDTSALWAGFMDGVRRTQDRYGASLTLIGRLTVGQDGTVARWTLLDGAREDQLDAPSDADLEVVVRAGVEALADAMGRRYAVLTDSAGPGDLRLTITRVSGPGDYARAFDYLRRLSLVSNVQPVAAGQDWVEFVLTTRVGARSLVQAIGTGRTLSPLPVMDRERVLRFELVR